MEGLMQNLQIVATIGSGLAVYVMLKQGSKKDVQELKSEIKEMKTEIRAIDSKIDVLKDDIHTEMKDFHGRLCTLEEKYQHMHEKIDSR